MSTPPIQDDCDLGVLVRRLGLPDTKNVVSLGDNDPVRALTPEEALVHWILDLPDRAAVDRAAEYALRTIDRGDGNTPEIDRLCTYLRQAKLAGAAPVLPAVRDGKSRRDTL